MFHYFNLLALIFLCNYSPVYAQEKKKKVKTPKLKSIDYGIEWIKIKGGSFMMGSDYERNDEQPIHHVKIKDFYMSKSEVTIAQYRKCVDSGICSKPISCIYGDPNWTDDVSDRENYPVNCIYWEQAKTYAKWVGGNLPSEAQWEYASRSQGKDIQYPWGNEEPNCEFANYNECGGGTDYVCNTLGNTEQGLCDMGGNVWEWMLDEWHDSYINAPSNDAGWCDDKDCKSKAHVLRGGSWDSNASRLRSANRSYNTPGTYGNTAITGFRVVKFAKSLK